MEKVIEGFAYILGNDIDTDQIIPAEHLVYSLSDPEERKNYGRFALSGVPSDQAGLPEGFANVLADSDRGASQGELFTTSTALEDLIGHPTRSLSDFISESLKANA